MKGLGQKYHPLTSKVTLIIFGLLLVSGFLTAYIGIPYLALLALPVNILYGTLVGMAGFSIPGILGQISLLVTYYAVAVIIAFIIHKVTGKKDPFS